MTELLFWCQQKIVTYQPYGARLRVTHRSDRHYYIQYFGILTYEHLPSIRSRSLHYEFPGSAVEALLYYELSLYGPVRIDHNASLPQRVVCCSQPPESDGHLWHWNQSNLLLVNSIINTILKKISPWNYVWWNLTDQHSPVSPRRGHRRGSCDHTYTHRPSLCDYAKRRHFNNLEGDLIGEGLERRHDGAGGGHRADFSILNLELYPRALHFDSIRDSRKGCQEQ